MSANAGRISAALADRYRIEREIGQGGMATVYLAEDLRHRRRVALKVLRPELAAVLGAERFVQEIATTAALQHPHILPLFDSGTADGFLYYVMPFIDGETLRARLDRETQLGIEEAVRIATNVADALDYAHRHGVIHRDIKPENILLHEGRPMVADFGIALAVSAAAGGRMTETGLSLGTPHYMSPEQATAEKDITARSDVYSLASVLYEMLAGQPPHIGGSVQQIIMKIITEPAAPVTALRKSVPHNVAAALDKALEKIPADRFDSAKTFANALGNVHFTSTAARPPSAAGQQRRRLAGNMAFAAVALVAFASAWLLKGDSAAPAPSAAIYRFELPEPAGFHSTGSAPNILPDGSGFSMLADGPEGRGVLLQSFAGGPPRFFDAPHAAIGNYVIGDGSAIMYYAFPGGIASQVQLLPFSGAPARVLTDSLRFGLVLDEAGRLYGTHLSIGGLARVDVSGQTTEVLTRPDTALGEIAHWFPIIVLDGRVVTFHISYRDDRPQRLAFLDLRNKRIYRSVEGSDVRLLPNGFLVFSRDTVLYAGRFDASNLGFSGTPSPVLRGVLAVDGGGFSVSRTGALLYRRPPERHWQLRPGGGASLEPMISADGEEIDRVRLDPSGDAALAVEGSTDMWVRARDGAARRLTAPAQMHRIAGWSRDGSRVLYVEFDGAPSYVYSASAVRGRLFMLRSDGTGAAPEPVGRGTGDRIREADWGRGGITYANMDGAIWWLADGQTEPVAVAASESGTGAQSRAAPAASPDSRFIAYRARNSSIVVSAIPPATGEWEVGPGLNPRWSRDGRYLYFDQPRLLYQQSPLPVMRVAVSPGAGFSFGKAEVASTPPPDATLVWDVGPDNVVYWITRKRRTESVLVINWAREVDSLVRAANGGMR